MELFIIVCVLVIVFAILKPQIKGVIGESVVASILSGLPEVNMGLTEDKFIPIVSVAWEEWDIMKIYVDADACPVVRIVESIAKKYNVHGKGGERWQSQAITIMTN